MVEKVGPRFMFLVSPDSICFTSPGVAPTGGNASNSIDAAAVLVCSCCWMAVWFPVIEMLILSTYALWIGSLLAFHAGFRTSVIDLAGV